MTKEPICSCCGAKIDGLLLDYSMRLPDNVLALSNEEYKYVSLPCKSLINYKDKDFYIRGLVSTAIKDTEQYLVFGVWVNVSEQDYKRAYAAWVESNDPKAVVDKPIFGYLANQFPLALYPDTFNHELIIFDIPETSAECLLKETTNPFSVEQYHGITMDRVHEIAKIMGYES